MGQFLSSIGIYRTNREIFNAGVPVSRAPRVNHDISCMARGRHLLYHRPHPSSHPIKIFLAWFWTSRWMRVAFVAVGIRFQLCRFCNEVSIGTDFLIRRPIDFFPRFFSSFFFFLYFFFFSPIEQNPVRTGAASTRESRSNCVASKIRWPRRVDSISSDTWTNAFAFLSFQDYFKKIEPRHLSVLFVLSVKNAAGRYRSSNDKV